MLSHLAMWPLLTQLLAGGSVQARGKVSSDQATYEITMCGLWRPACNWVHTDLLHPNPKRPPWSALLTVRIPKVFLQHFIILLHKWCMSVFSGPSQRKKYDELPSAGCSPVFSLVLLCTHTHTLQNQGTPCGLCQIFIVFFNVIVQ